MEPLVILDSDIRGEAQAYFDLFLSLNVAPKATVNWLRACRLHYLNAVLFLGFASKPDLAVKPHLYLKSPSPTV